MKNYNILVFPCGTEIANEIINSLENHKYFKLHFASSEGVSYCSYRSRNINILPYVTSNTFEEKLNNLIKDKKIDFIIPAHDDVAYILSILENKLNAKVVGQTQQVNEIVRFKDKTYKHFQNLLPIAKIFENIPEENSFPVFTKPIKGQGSLNAQKLDSLKEYNNFFSNHKRDEFVVMEYLMGEEFTIDCFSDKGNILYFGARTREKTTRGISVQSTFVSDKDLNKEFEKYAIIISKELNLNGIWFFQMKFNKNKELKLLEIGPRVSGTMMLNRARGINFVELAIYQKLGFNVEVIVNDIDISLARALVPIYKHNMEFDNLYIDFDDTLLLEEKYINPEIMRLIFQSKNKDKKVYLITKNKKFNLAKTLHKFGITTIFDEIIHISESDKKVDYMKHKSVLIDDSFKERKEAIQNGMYALSIDNLKLLEV
jgi:hypothetical protein